MIAEYLINLLHSKNILVESVSIGKINIRSTWKVQPIELQEAAQPFIDSFNPNDLNLIARENLARFTTTSRQKDILAMIALIVRAKNVTAWNAMTIAQKKTAVLAEADIWVMIRQFIEDEMGNE